MSVQGILYQKGTHVITIDQEAGIDRAAEVMREHRVAALPVTNGSKVVGMLSSRNIVEGFSRHASRLAAMHVSDLMQRNFVRISSHESIKRVMALMTQYRATHIPVFDAERLTGIVSIGDVVKHRLEDLELETNVLRDAYIAAH
jgi:CBS domain-containing protein